MKTEEHERAAELIAMLLRDPAARASFRREPAAMARAHGLDDVADELAGRDGALQNLDVRESRSSVAGVLIAAAAEGVAFFAFVDNAHADGGGGGGGSLSPDVARIVDAHAPAHAGRRARGQRRRRRARGRRRGRRLASGAAAGRRERAAAGGRGRLHAAARGRGRGSGDAVATPVPPDLLHDTRLSLSDTASEALATAGPSSRTSQILSSLVEHHTIGVSAMSPDGSFTITMVDGAPVEPREHRRARPRRAALGPRSGDSADGHRHALADEPGRLLQRRRPLPPHRGRLRRSRRRSR